MGSSVSRNDSKTRSPPVLWLCCLPHVASKINMLFCIKPMKRENALKEAVEGSYWPGSRAHHVFSHSVGQHLVPGHTPLQGRLGNSPGLCSGSRGKQFGEVLSLLTLSGYFSQFHENCVCVLNTPFLCLDSCTSLYLDHPFLLSFFST